MFKTYIKKQSQRMRPYIPGEDLSKVSIGPDTIPGQGGMIAVGTDESDQWYVSEEYFKLNYVEAESSMFVIGKYVWAIRSCAKIMRGRCYTLKSIGEHGQLELEEVGGFFNEEMFYTVEQGS